MTPVKALYEVIMSIAWLDCVPKKPGAMVERASRNPEIKDALLRLTSDDAKNMRPDLYYLPSKSAEWAEATRPVYKRQHGPVAHR